MENENLKFLEPLINSYKNFWINWSDFNGLTNKQEFFNVFVVNLVISVLLVLITPKLVYLFSLANLIPGLAISARRLNDIKNSRWLLLLYLIPFVSLLFYIYLLVANNKD